MQILQVAQYMCLLRYIWKDKKSVYLVWTNLGLMMVFDKYLGRTLGQSAIFAIAQYMCLLRYYYILKKEKVCV